MWVKPNTSVMDVRHIKMKITRFSLRNRTYPARLCNTDSRSGCPVLADLPIIRSTEAEPM